MACAAPQGAVHGRCPPSVLFEVLDLAFVLFGGGARLERAKIAPTLGFRIDFAGIQSIFAGLKFANHVLGASSEYFISSRLPNVDHSQRSA
jgi:hypothetical protein